MKSHHLVCAVVSIVLLSGCSVTAKRGECEFMLPSERERCLQANKANEEALKTRRESKRETQRPFVVPTKKEGGDSAADSRNP